MDQLLLGLDIGTSHVKAVVTTVEGMVLAKAQVDYPTYFPKPGWAEQFPSDWWQGIIAVTRSVIGQIKGVIAGIGVSGQGCAVTLIDNKGDVIRPAIIWMDSRAEPQCQRLRDCCLVDVLARNGKSPAPYNADPVLMWLMENEPDTIKKSRTSLTTTAYINFRLTGQVVANLSDASILLGFDLERKTWSETLIHSFALPTKLYPPLAACDEIIGHLTYAAAKDLGLPAGIPVIAGGEDTSSAGLASGATRPGLAYLSLGTAGTVNVSMSKLAIHPQLLTFLHVLSGQYLMGGSMVALGGSLAWCRKILDAHLDMESIIALAAHSEPGAGQLIFLPYMSGELQPINDGYARGVFFGLSLSTERSHIVRAILEGTAFAIAHNLSIIETLGVPVIEIRAVGRPTRSPLWCQIIADITGRPLRVLTDDGGAPLGNALLAGKGVGLIDDLAEVALNAVNIESSYEPNVRLFPLYQAQFAIYRQLYPMMKEQFARLSNL